MAEAPARPVDRLLLLDVNLLVALCVTTHQHHRAAHRFLAQVSGRWATCPVTEASLYRLLLNLSVTGSQRSVGEVTRVIRGLRQDPRWTFLPDPTTLAQPAVDTSVLMGHQQVTDLHLVNLAAHHGSVLATFDSALPTWVAPSDRSHVLVVPA